MSCLASTSLPAAKGREPKYGEKRQYNAACITHSLGNGLLLGHVGRYMGQKVCDGDGRSRWKQRTAKETRFTRRSAQLYSLLHGHSQVFKRTMWTENES